MSLLRFNSYANCDLKWLNEYPSHWSRTKIKFVCGFQTGWTPPSGKDELYDGDNLWANISDLGSRVIYDTAKRISDTAVAASKIRVSPEGSLLFSFKLSIGIVSFAGCDLYTNEAIATFLHGPKLDLQFGYYALPLNIIQNAVENIYGAKMLNQELIRNAEFICPPLSEQRSIAAFLDRETAKIDALIEEQKRLIELLKEKRQAVISHAVTKGLDPSAPMKDSGVEWLGQVPAHWELVQFKRIIDIQNGSDYKNIEEIEGFPVYGSGGVFTYASDFLYDGASVLLGRKGTIDKPLFVDGRFWTVDTMFWTKIKANAVPRYVFYTALTIPFQYYATNTALPSMTKEALGGHLVALPPLDDQNAISAALDRETARIDGLGEQAESAIVLLKERRAALISAAVTGKIDVRGLVAEEAEAAQ